MNLTCRENNIPDPNSEREGKCLLVLLKGK